MRFHPKDDETRVGDPYEHVLDWRQTTDLLMGSLNRLVATAPICGSEWMEILAVSVLAYLVVGLEKRLRVAAARR